MTESWLRARVRAGDVPSEWSLAAALGDPLALSAGVTPAEVEDPWKAVLDGLGERELRLLACDCAERALRRQEQVDPRCWRVVEIARLYARGGTTRAELAAARDAAQDAVWDAREAAQVWDARDAAQDAAWCAASSAALDGAVVAARDAAWDAASSAASSAALDGAVVAAWDAAQDAASFARATWWQARATEEKWQCKRAALYLTGRLL